MIDALVKAVQAKLQATSALTTLLATQPGSISAIYYKQAPTTAIMPYVVFNHAGGGSDNETQLESADVMFYVKGVAVNSAAAGAISGAIYTALHKQESGMTIDSPWKVYRCQHREIISLIENESRTQIHHEGGSYRVRISQ